MIEIPKACTVVSMKARNSLVVQCREKKANWKKEAEDRENLFFNPNKAGLFEGSFSWGRGKGGGGSI